MYIMISVANVKATKESVGWKQFFYNYFPFLMYTR